MKNKIALEEHLSTPENNRLWNVAGEASRNGKAYMDDVEKRLVDPKIRLAEMDRYGIAAMIMSLTSPGAQAVLDPKLAVEFAQRTNDLIAAEYVRSFPGRFYGFAVVALQNPKAAADELERAVKQLGFKGALINGYTNIGDADTAQYLDEPSVREFWDRVAALDVPVYLHPREPLPSQRRIYQGYDSLIGSALGFAFETSAHAVRLMLSGLFDEYPKLKVILGHLGEGLSQLLPRVESRLYMQRNGMGLGKAKRPVTEYYSRNFYVTTSGHFHTKALLNTISEVGVDHVMFSVDYPYERMDLGAPWFDNALIAENDREKIGRKNAEELFGIRSSC